MKWLGPSSLVLTLLACVPSDQARNEPTSATSVETPAVVIGPHERLSYLDLVADGLYNPTSLSVSSAGDLCVADSGNQRVLVLSSRLESGPIIGRGGSGPGEFRGGLRCSWSPARELMVFDSFQSRLSVFSVDGAFLRDAPRMGGASHSVLTGAGDLISVHRDWSAFAIHRQDGTSIDVPFQLPCSGGPTLGPPVAELGNTGLVAAVRPIACGRTAYVIAVLDPAEQTVAVSSFGLVREMPESTAGGAALAIMSAAADGQRLYVAHAYSIRVGDVFGFPVDVLDVTSLELITRVYLERPGLIAAASSGSLYFLDPKDEQLLIYKELATSP